MANAEKDHKVVGLSPFVRKVLAPTCKNSKQATKQVVEAEVIDCSNGFTGIEGQVPVHDLIHRGAEGVQER